MSSDSLPVATADDELWLFVKLLGDALIGVGRLGYHCTSGVIGIFPTDLFGVHGIVPINRFTNEPYSDIRWATVADLDHYTDDYVLAC